MKFTVGDKVTMFLRNGVALPAVIVTEPERQESSFVSRTTGENIDSYIITADLVSLRRTDRGEGDPYLRLSNEALQFGNFRQTVVPRASTIVGLDATEDGEKVSIADLLDQSAEALGKFFATRYEAQKGATAVEDL